MWNNKTDEELVREILSPLSGQSSGAEMLNSRGALNELLSRQYGWIMRVCVAELQNESLSFDCCQDILTRIALGVKNFKFNSKFSTWCYVIVRRAIWEFRRNRKRQEVREPLFLDAPEEHSPMGETADPKLSPAELVEQRENLETLWKQLDELPAKQREAIILHYFEDLPVAQAAERAGCSVASFKTHLFRGRERLRKLIETDGMS